MSIIKDPGLAPEGARKINWVKRHMPVLRKLEAENSREQSFEGLKVAICLHLEAKTAYLAQVFARSGAEVAIAGSNPLSTQDAVAAALAEEGMNVFAVHGATEKKFKEHLRQVLKTEPDLIVDDGGDLVSIIHQEMPGLSKKIMGSAEETTTGLIRLRSMEKEGVLSFPAVAVNDAFCKHLFDNRHGTGQSVWDGIMRATNLVIAGKTVVVAGFGWCGKGVALRARGLGARVIVTEVDPVKALEAVMEGYEVRPLKEAAPLADLVITVAGVNRVVNREHYSYLKDGAMLANAGHFDVEIDKKDLYHYADSYTQAQPNVEEFILPGGKTLYLLAEGRLVNLAAADGHPAEIMDLSFALQFMALKYLKEKHKQLPFSLLSVPPEIDGEIARLKLQEMGVSIDTLMEEQKKYMESW